MFETIADAATDNPVSRWEFMNEPIWRWFLFLGALALMLAAWRGVLAYMK